MSRHALDSEHYTSSETFLLEQKYIFKSLWIFAGFTSQVQECNQFFTRKIAGVPVVVQRTDTGIRAFLNQCPHRLSPIQTECVGRRPLVCPYHAWSFDAEGRLRGMPNSGIYNINATEREKIGLRKLHLTQVGSLLFINLASDPLPIDQQFSEDFLESLSVASSHLDARLIYSCHRVLYNWKLSMENVKDHNHVPFVHPKTFLPLMQSTTPVVVSAAEVASPIEKMLRENNRPALSELSYAGKSPVKPQQNWFGDLCFRYGVEDFYYNWFVYPNVNFCSVRGEYFLLQQYLPVTPGETDYHLWVMTAKRKDPRTDLTALLHALIKGEREVIAEDTEVLERMQAGLGDHSLPFMHGDYEVPLVNQHLWYRHHVLGEAV